MLANFLGKSKPINFIVYLGLFICFFLITVLSNFYTDEFTWYKAFESISFLILIHIIFFSYNFIVSKNKLTFDHSYAIFLFILVTILFIPKLLAFKTLLIILVYLLFLRKIYSLRSSKKVIQKVFDSAFWLGVLCILKPFSILFFIIIYAAILLHKKATINALITPIIGFISPVIIYFAYLFWNDEIEEFVQPFYLNNYKNIYINTDDNFFWISVIIICLTIISIILKSAKTLSVNNSFKKSWLLLILNLIITIIFALITTTKNGSEIIFLMIPASIIIANGFEVIEKRVLKNILFALLIIATVVGFFWL